MNQKLLLGQTLWFDGDPFEQEWENVSHHQTDGAIVIQDGHIIGRGSRSALLEAYPRADITDYGNDLILPGFVDAHVHYPQTAIIASWGKRLIDWLNSYTFPEEMRLSDPSYAADIAVRYLDIALAHGTTTMASYCTSSPTSVTAYFEAAANRGMRVIGGKTCMDRNAPDGLVDTAQRAYDESKALADAWHGNGRAIYAITPRFSPTSTPEQLQALGALWAERPTCLMQTHLSEQREEVAWVKNLFPDARDYLDTYESYGLLGKRGVYGHSIHLEPREAARLATDIGGGSNFSMLRTMAAAYEVAQLRGAVLHPAQLMWLASEGSAQALHLQGIIGHLGIGAEADLCILDLSSTSGIVQRVNNAEDFWENLFPTIMMGDDRAVRDVWIAGDLVG